MRSLHSRWDVALRAPPQPKALRARQGDTLIESDAELAQKVAEVSAGLQEIQDYLGDRSSSLGKVRFPRGFLKTAAHHRKKLWYLRKPTRQNVSYSMQSYDILRFIANRTDLGGPAKNLLNRLGIVILGSVAEAVAVNGTSGLIGKNARYKNRLKHMHETHGIITKALREDLEWLWDSRNSIHLDKLTAPHIDLFTVRDVNRARRIIDDLKGALDKWHTDQLPF